VIVAKVYCITCNTTVGVDEAGRFALHGCVDDGARPHRSQLPGFHPRHVCGMFCDGQDGRNSKCAQERRRGPPSAIELLGLLGPIG
jgi:hypothetical protein